MGELFAYTKCCFCFNLRVGCLIIGYLQLVAELIYSVLILIGLVAGGVAASSDDQDVQVVGIVFLVISIILLLFLLLSLAFTITLLVGVHNNRLGHIKAYLTFAWIFAILGIIFFFCTFAQPQPMAKIAGNVISLMFYLYFTLVIRSYHESLIDASRPVGQVPPAYKV